MPSIINLATAAVLTTVKNKTPNWIRTHNHLVHKRTLNHLAKLAK